MIAVDTNVLVYADRTELSHHEAALRALRTLAEGDAAWALPVFCIAEFVRVVSHPKLFDPPTPPAEAVESLESLFASPSLRVLHPGPRFWPLLRRMIDEAHASGNLIYDAQIAAVCLEHGARTLLTEDRDFARFRSIQMRSISDPGPLA